MSEIDLAKSKKYKKIFLDEVELILKNIFLTWRSRTHTFFDFELISYAVSNIFETFFLLLVQV